MEAQAALIFLHYTMVVVPLILLLLVPLIISELHTVKPQVDWSVSGFVVVGVKSHRVGAAYHVRFQRSSRR